MEQSFEMQLKKLCWLIEACEKTRLTLDQAELLADRAWDIWDPETLFGLRDRLGGIDQMSDETLEKILDEFIADKGELLSDRDFCDRFDRATKGLSQAEKEELFQLPSDKLKEWVNSHKPDDD